MQIPISNINTCIKRRWDGSPFLILTPVLNGDRTIRHWLAVFRLMQSRSPGRPAQSGTIHPVSKNEVRTSPSLITLCSAYPKTGLPAQIRAKTTGSGCLHGVGANCQRSMHDPPRLKPASLRCSSCRRDQFSTGLASGEDANGCG